VKIPEPAALTTPASVAGPALSSTPENAESPPLASVIAVVPAESVKYAVKNLSSALVTVPPKVPLLKEVRETQVLAVAVVPRFVLPAIVATPALGSSAAAALAGTTDKSPNPSEATAIADTFFNEIVFTIFLSFSQIKEFLLSGW
jgi:hypothetical protein